MSPRLRKGLLGCALGLGLCACVTPSARVEREAARLGFTRERVRGADFSHVVYQRGAAGDAARWHVYLGGDGSPRRAIRHDPPDPTPPEPVALRLMALDPAPSLLLGHPCQHAASPCDPRFWTRERYSEPVVSSLVAALRRRLPPRPDRELVLIGFSGGGALAMLLAERVPETVAVVTIAGNLDVAAWAAHHGYAPLEGSLDPARRPPLDPALRQLHLLAARDERVPPALSEPVIARQAQARAIRYADFDHDCCWESVWPELLAELERELSPLR
jgi:pimeloyl-ACP methyl ester carboxylesterase